MTDTTINCLPPVCSFTVEVDLIAGGGSSKSALDVGSVNYTYDNGTLTVTYLIEEEGWYLNETHFDYSKGDLSEIPLNKGGNPKIGQFDFKDEDLFSDQHSYTVDIGPLYEGEIINLAAHSVVFKPGGLEGLELTLPDQVDMKVYSGTSSYFDIQMDMDQDGELDSEVHTGWCADIGHTISTNTLYTANVYSSYETLPENVNIDKPDNLAAVNWLINEFSVGDTLYDELVYGGYNNAHPSQYPNDGSLVGGGYSENPQPYNSLGDITAGDIQRAIWGLIDHSQSDPGMPYNDARADELADRAYVHHREFVPECDDVVALVLQPINTTSQITIAQITMAELDVPCESQEETAWGQGDPFTNSSWAMYTPFEVECDNMETMPV
jgi:hypothetical protein